MSGRILPAAYATLCTSLAVSARAWSPLTGFFERAARTLVGSWMYGHVLTKPVLLAILGLPEPLTAAVVARVRLVVQLVDRAPLAVFDIFDAAWNRATPWCEVLADSVRQVAVALPGAPCPAASIAFVRQHSRPLLKACKKLSRWGTIQGAVWDLWADVVHPREKQVVGASLPRSCPLCQARLPSVHALAAHLHRKHSVVNVLTRFTQGTVCLWCNCEQHSTDRLKYHLRVHPDCVHGLRVTVGEAYVYGSGTKRARPRAHRGLPAFRLCGPLNATPAQRIAALEGRRCTPAELAEELRQVTGATNVYSWPGAALSPDCLPSVPIDGVVSSVDAPLASAIGTPCSGRVRWFTLLVPSTVAASDLLVPSPFWPGLLRAPFACQLPSAWHRYWKIWHAMHSVASWSPHAFTASSVLRQAVTGPADLGARGPAPALLDFLAATVAFRSVCDALWEHGLIWIFGTPSRAGLLLLRALLPSACFSSLQLSGSSVFVVSHTLRPPPCWRRDLGDLLSCGPGAASPRVLPVRASFVYRTRSPGFG